MSAGPRPRVYYSRPHHQQEQHFNPWMLRIPILIGAALILALFLGIAGVAGYQMEYKNRIYPGVSTVYGVNMAGMTQQEAMQALAEQPDYTERAQFVFIYQNETWEYSATDLGLRFEIEQTVDAAYSVGRNSSAFGNLANQWKTYNNGHLVQPIISYDRDRALQIIERLARDYINQPMQNAELTVHENRAYASPSQVGRSVDINATLLLLEHQLKNLNDRIEIAIVYNDEYPRIVSADEAAARVNLALSGDVMFYVPETYNVDTGPWPASPDSIVSMLNIQIIENEDGTARYEVNLTNDQARDFLTRIAPELQSEPINTRFVFNDDERELEVLEPGINGRRLDVETTLPLFDEAVFSTDNREVPLMFQEVRPDIHDELTGEELGITELVNTSTTYYYNSTAARRTNIQVAASRFHGIVIPPNSEFSFNEWLGDVSLGEGYEEALIIVGGQTINGVGGGVCQVSTTIYQAAFETGFPILERYPHGYRVAYYEQGAGAGMDATVYSPIVDFRFLNDTEYHLLIEVYVRPSNSTITFKFYSTDTGRQVTKEGPYIRNVRPAPPPIYRATPGIPQGAAYQVDYAVSGADVYIYRTIKDADGNVIKDREEFHSYYMPWPSQFQVAPGDPRVNG